MVSVIKLGSDGNPVVIIITLGRWQFCDEGSHTRYASILRRVIILGRQQSCGECYHNG